MTAADPRGKGEAATPRLAAEALLQRDARPREVVVDEILREFTLGDSDATRCVKLGAAKLAYQELHPETTRGRARKPKRGGKNAGTAVFPPFEQHAEKVIGGWKARTISRWCKIGLGLSHVAYGRLLGTPLATDLAALETLALLREEERQVDVADLFAQRLDREGRDLLANLATQAADPTTADPPIDVTAPEWADLVQWGADDAPAPPTPPVVENPLPEHATELVLTKAADGKEVYGILHGNVLAIADLGDSLRLTYLGKARAASKPDVINRESWIDAVGRAAQSINTEGRYVATVSQIARVPPTPSTPAHHVMTIRCEPTLPLGAKREIVIKVTRWENADPTLGFGEGFAFDPYRSKLPVLTLDKSPFPIPYDWTEAHPHGPDFAARSKSPHGEVVASGNYATIEESILAYVAPIAWRNWRPNVSGVSPEEYVRGVLVAKAERRELAYFRWKSREWFDSHGRKRCFVEQSTDRDRRLAVVLFWPAEPPAPADRFSGKGRR